MTKQEIEMAVRKANQEMNENKKSTISSLITPDAISAKQMKNLMNGFAQGCKAEDIVLLGDTTLFNSGKSGIVFSISAYYQSNINFLNKQEPISLPVLYDDLSDVTELDDSHYELHGKDGRVRRAFGSIYTPFVVAALRNILALKSSSAGSVDLEPFETEIPADGSNQITIYDESGKPVIFEVLDVITYKGQDYAVLLEPDNTDGYVTILRVEDAGDGENENYLSVEDETTLTKVFNIFRQHYE